MSTALGTASHPVRSSAPQVPPYTQNPSSEISQPSHERIQNVLLSQASVAAQQPLSSRTQPNFHLGFPPRRPLRHQAPQIQLALGPSQARLPTSQAANTLFSAGGVSSNSIASSSIPTTPPTLGTAAVQIPTFAGSAALFDGVWRGMLERVYSELAHVHTIYASALRKEQQEKEVFRAHCVRLKGERDIAREKLRRVFGRKYEDNVPQIPVLDASTPATASGPLSSSGVGGPSSSREAGAAEMVDEQMCTPPLSASSVVSNFCSTSPALPSAQVPSEMTGSLVPSPQQRTSELVDVHRYPSPSPSCSSPLPPQSPIAFITKPLLSQERSSCSVQKSGAGDASTLNDFESRKRECPGNENEEEGRAAKRQRSLESEDPEESASLTSGHASMAEDGKQDVGCSADTNQYEDLQQPNEEASSLLPPETTKRWNIPFDLMFMLTEETVVCRVCAYKHSRGDGLSPKIFSPSTTWEELTAHCEQQHPAACAEVSVMGPREVMELRHRMTMLANAGSQ